jgi:hypothetical protein
LRHASIRRVALARRPVGMYWKKCRRVLSNLELPYRTRLRVRFENHDSTLFLKGEIKCHALH